MSQPIVIVVDAGQVLTWTAVLALACLVRLLWKVGS